MATDGVASAVKVKVSADCAVHLTPADVYAILSDEVAPELNPTITLLVAVTFDALTVCV